MRRRSSRYASPGMRRSITSSRASAARRVSARPIRAPSSRTSYEVLCARSRRVRKRPSRRRAGARLRPGLETTTRRRGAVEGRGGGCRRRCGCGFTVVVAAAPRHEQEGCRPRGETPHRRRAATASSVWPYGSVRPGRASQRLGTQEAAADDGDEARRLPRRDPVPALRRCVRRVTARADWRARPASRTCWSTSLITTSSNSSFAERQLPQRSDLQSAPARACARARSPRSRCPRPRPPRRSRGRAASAGIPGPAARVEHAPSGPMESIIEQRRRQLAHAAVPPVPLLMPKMYVVGRDAGCERGAGGHRSHRRRARSNAAYAFG